MEAITDISTLGGNISKTTLFTDTGDENSYAEKCLNLHRLSRPTNVWYPNHSSPIEMCKLTVNILGITGNLVFFIILRTKHVGSRLAVFFFSCQCILDLMVCLISAILILQPNMWLVGKSPFWHLLICKGWHSLILYIFFIQFSIVNLVLIGLERYCAVVRPLMYQKLSVKHHGRICIIIILLYSLVFAIPSLWETKYLQLCGVGLCIGQVFTSQVKLMLKIYSVMWFIFIYVLSFILLVFFYSRVIVKLRYSRNIARSTRKDRAAEQFTRMAIVVTIVYLLCMTYDSFAYMLGRMEVWQYNYNTLAHQMGLFLISLNSCANPYIYFFFVIWSSLVHKNRRHSRGGKSSLGMSEFFLRYSGLSNITGKFRNLKVVDASIHESSKTSSFLTV